MASTKLGQWDIEPYQLTGTIAQKSKALADRNLERYQSGEKEQIALMAKQFIKSLPNTKDKVYDYQQADIALKDISYSNSAKSIKKMLDEIESGAFVPEDHYDGNSFLRHHKDGTGISPGMYFSKTDLTADEILRHKLIAHAYNIKRLPHQPTEKQMDNLVSTLRREHYANTIDNFQKSQAKIDNMEEYVVTKSELAGEGVEKIRDRIWARAVSGAAAAWSLADAVRGDQEMAAYQHGVGAIQSQVAKEESSGFFETAVGFGAELSPQLVPVVLGGLAAGPWGAALGLGRIAQLSIMGGGALFLGATEGNATTQQAIKEGMPIKEAQIRGAIVGTAVGLLEHVLRGSSKYMMPGMKSKVIGRINYTGHYAKSAFITPIVEALEESSQELAKITEEFLRDPDYRSLAVADKDGKMNLTKTLENLWESGKGGFFGGMIFKGVADGMNSWRIRQNYQEAGLMADMKSKLNQSGHKVANNEMVWDILNRTNPKHKEKMKNSNLEKGEEGSEERKAYDKHSGEMWYEAMVESQKEVVKITYAQTQKFMKNSRVTQGKDGRFTVETPDGIKIAAIPRDLTANVDALIAAGMSPEEAETHRNKQSRGYTPGVGEEVGQYQEGAQTIDGVKVNGLIFYNPEIGDHTTIPHEMGHQYLRHFTSKDIIGRLVNQIKAKDDIEKSKIHGMAEEDVVSGAEGRLEQDQNAWVKTIRWFEDAIADLEIHMKGDEASYASKRSAAEREVARGIGVESGTRGQRIADKIAGSIFSKVGKAGIGVARTAEAAWRSNAGQSIKDVGAAAVKVVKDFDLDENINDGKTMSFFKKQGRSVQGAVNAAGSTQAAQSAAKAGRSILQSETGQAALDFANDTGASIKNIFNKTVTQVGETSKGAVNAVWGHIKPNGAVEEVEGETASTGKKDLEVSSEGKSGVLNAEDAGKYLDKSVHGFSNLIQEIRQIVQEIAMLRRTDMPENEQARANLERRLKKLIDAKNELLEGAESLVEVTSKHMPTGLKSVIQDMTDILNSFLNKSSIYNDLKTYASAKSMLDLVKDAGLIAGNLYTDTVARLTADKKVAEDNLKKAKAQKKQSKIAKVNIDKHFNTFGLVPKEWIGLTQDEANQKMLEIEEEPTAQQVEMIEKFISGAYELELQEFTAARAALKVKMHENQNKVNLTKAQQDEIDKRNNETNQEDSSQEILKKMVADTQTTLTQEKNKLKAEIRQKEIDAVMGPPAPKSVRKLKSEVAAEAAAGLDPDTGIDIKAVQDMTTAEANVIIQNTAENLTPEQVQVVKDIRSDNYGKEPGMADNPTVNLMGENIPKSAVTRRLLKEKVYTISRKKLAQHMKDGTISPVEIAEVTESLAKRSAKAKLYREAKGNMDVGRNQLAREKGDSLSHNFDFIVFKEIVDKDLKIITDAKKKLFDEAQALKKVAWVKNKKTGKDESQIVSTPEYEKQIASINAKIENLVMLTELAVRRRFGKYVRETKDLNHIGSYIHAIEGLFIENVMDKNGDTTPIIPSTFFGDILITKEEAKSRGSDFLDKWGSGDKRKLWNSVIKGLVFEANAFLVPLYREAITTNGWLDTDRAYIAEGKFDPKSELALQSQASITLYAGLEALDMRQTERLALDKKHREEATDIWTINEISRELIRDIELISHARNELKIAYDRSISGGTAKSENATSSIIYAQEQDAITNLINDMNQRTDKNLKLLRQRTDEGNSTDNLEGMSVHEMYGVRSDGLFASHAAKEQFLAQLSGSLKLWSQTEEDSNFGHGISWKLKYDRNPDGSPVLYVLKDGEKVLDDAGKPRIDEANGEPYFQGPSGGLMKYSIQARVFDLEVEKQIIMRKGSRAGAAKAAIEEYELVFNTHHVRKYKDPVTKEWRTGTFQSYYTDDYINKLLKSHAYDTLRLVRKMVGYRDESHRWPLILGSHFGFGEKATREERIAIGKTPAFRVIHSAFVDAIDLQARMVWSTLQGAYDEKRMSDMTEKQKESRMNFNSKTMFGNRVTSSNTQGLNKHEDQFMVERYIHMVKGAERDYKGTDKTLIKENQKWTRRNVAKVIRIIADRAMDKTGMSELRQWTKYMKSKEDIEADNKEIMALFGREIASFQDRYALTEAGVNVLADVINREIEHSERMDVVLEEKADLTEKLGRKGFFLSRKEDPAERARFQKELDALKEEEGILGDKLFTLKDIGGSLKDKGIGAIMTLINLYVMNQAGERAILANSETQDIEGSQDVNYALINRYKKAIGIPKVAPRAKSVLTQGSGESTEDYRARIRSDMMQNFIKAQEEKLPGNPLYNFVVDQDYEDGLHHVLSLWRSANDEATIPNLLSNRNVTTPSDPEGLNLADENAQEEVARRDAIQVAASRGEVQTDKPDESSSGLGLDGEIREENLIKSGTLTKQQIKEDPANNVLLEFIEPTTTQAKLLVELRKILSSLDKEAFAELRGGKEGLLSDVKKRSITLSDKTADRLRKYLRSTPAMHMKPLQADALSWIMTANPSYVWGTTYTEGRSGGHNQLALEADPMTPDQLFMKDWVGKRMVRNLMTNVKTYLIERSFNQTFISPTMGFRNSYRAEDPELARYSYASQLYIDSVMHGADFNAKATELGILFRDMETTHADYENTKRWLDAWDAVPDIVNKTGKGAKVRDIIDNEILPAIEGDSSYASEGQIPLNVPTHWVAHIYERPDADQFPLYKHFGPNAGRVVSEYKGGLAEAALNGDFLKYTDISENYKAGSRAIVNAVSDKDYIDRGFKEKHHHKHAGFGLEKYDHPAMTWPQRIGEAEKDKVYGPDFEVIDNIVYQKMPIYGPAGLVKHHNNIMRNSKWRQNAVWAEVMDVNATLKSWKLVSSAFHYWSEWRSAVFGGHDKWLILPHRYMQFLRDGKDAMLRLDPELMEGVYEGLMLAENQDFDKELAFNNRVAKFIESRQTNVFNPAAKALRRVSRELSDNNRFLFEVITSSTKAALYLGEYHHQIAKHKKKMDAMTVEEAEVFRKQIVREVVRMINYDTGILPLDMMGRNPEFQDVLKIATLGPDWVESNLRSALGPMTGTRLGRKMHREMWMRIGARGIMTVFLMSMMMAPLDDKDDRFRSAWKEGHLAWMGVDITPISVFLGGDRDNRKYLRVMGHLIDPIEWVGHPLDKLHAKSGGLTKPILNAFRGTDYAGKTYTTISEINRLGLSSYYSSKSQSNGPINPSQAASWFISEIGNTIPITARNFLSFLAGKADMLDTMVMLSGHDVHRTKHAS